MLNHLFILKEGDSGFGPGLSDSSLCSVVLSTTCPRPKGFKMVSWLCSLSIVEETCHGNLILKLLLQTSLSSLNEGFICSAALSCSAMSNSL